ncbi:MAG: NAD(P)/FAD-dependent oxidoreductase [Bacilli bacterium]|nr:NAD(P)/FAD-dependent oxidoreductase [Bacilli bacterium]
MMRSYDVIVVGGGIAGLTATAYLAKAGVRVLLCEQQEKVGGLVGTFEREGFSFDQGIRAFEDSGILLPMIKSLGIDMTFISNPVQIGIKNDMISIDNKESLNDYAKLLKSHFPDEKNAIDIITEKIRQVMMYMDVLYGIENPLFLEGKLDSKYLLHTLLPWLIKYNRSMKKVKAFHGDVVTYLKQFTQNQSLIDMITQHFFKNTPAFFALSYFGFYTDYRYPLGGTGTLTKKLEEVILKYGGEIACKTRVIAVDQKQKTITTEAKEVIGYHDLVWAANIKTLYRNLAHLPSRKGRKLSALMNKSHGSDSILTCYFGIRMNSEKLLKYVGIHSFYTPDSRGLHNLSTWKDAPNLSTWVSQYLDYTTYEISCPSLRDPSLAPDGQSSLIVSTLFDYDLTARFSDHRQMEEFKKFILKKVKDVLEKSVLPDLSNLIVFESCSTPLTIESLTSNADGAITGWSFANEVIPSEHRFPQIRKSIRTTIPHIYQCGQWTFSPAGMPVSILTGKLAADKIIKKRK